MRLDKFLSDCGAGSRRDIKKAVKDGRVSVDGAVEKDPAAQIAETAAVCFDGTPVAYRRFVYIMMNKPGGVVSATEDNVYPTVLSLLPEEYARFDLFPCGRLDVDTEGFLLLTNDGQTAHKLLSPKYKQPKTYFARVEGALPPHAAERFAAGMDLGDFTAQPARLRVLSVGDVSEAEVTVTEGKFHQVKRMFLALGTPVLYLKRLSFAGLSLDPALSPGAFRELTAQETAILCNPTK